MTCTRQRMLFGRTSVSEPSRFLEEVPSENADWVGRQAQGASGFGDTSFDEGSSYSTRGYGSYGQGAARYDSVMQRRPKSQASQKLAAQKPAASAAETDSSPAFSIHASRVLPLAAWESRRFPVSSCSVTGRSAAASTASPMACPVAVIRRSRSPPSRRNASVQ